MEIIILFHVFPTRYCQQVLNETVRTAKLTPMAARLQEVEGKVDQHVIPKEVRTCLSHYQANTKTRKTAGFKCQSFTKFYTCMFIFI